MKGATLKYVVYDLEIIKSIPSKNEPRLNHIEYCEGWNDYKGMGISVLGAYDSCEDRYRIFGADNISDFHDLLSDRDIWVTFNGINFDDKVIEANWFTLPVESNFVHQRKYDILREQWAADGLDPNRFDSTTHKNYGLDITCHRTFNDHKRGNGAFAPILWQTGKIAQVIDYCLSDVWLTKRLFDCILKGEPLIGPNKHLILPVPK